MSENSNISWTDHTFNPWIGCTKVSPGCANCYAAEQNKLRKWTADGAWNAARTRTSAANWKKPLQWNDQPMQLDDKGGHRRTRVFCASLADWLDDQVPVEWLADLLRLIYKTPDLDWLLLTKRPENFNDRIEAAFRVSANDRNDPHFTNWLASWHVADGCEEGEPDRPPENVWIGTTVENQEYARKRIPALLLIPAKVRFLSVEPMLGPVDLSLEGLWKHTCEREAREYIVHADDGKSHPEICREQADKWMDAREQARNVDWVICGGESGGHRRAFDPVWAKNLAWQCEKAHVPFFMKQDAALHPGKQGRLEDWLWNRKEFPA